MLKELFLRAFQRKWIVLCLFLLLLSSTMCGIVFIKTPTFYEYQLRICDRFLDRVCYSDRSVFLIFIERTAGCALLLFLVLIGGVHPAALALSAMVMAFRGYTFGGTVAILFSVYGMSGAIVAFALYIPIRILADGVLLLAAAVSFSRAFCFRFCAGDIKELLADFLLLSVLILMICLLEAVLLAALFHPLGNLL